MPLSREIPRMWLRSFYPFPDRNYNHFSAGRHPAATMVALAGQLVRDRLVNDLSRGNASPRDNFLQLVTPRLGRSRTSRFAALERHGKLFHNQYFTNVATVRCQYAAATLVIAGDRSFGARRASARDK